jgi:hypothetical protein
VLGLSAEGYRLCNEDHTLLIVASSHPSIYLAIYILHTSIERCVPASVSVDGRVEAICMHPVSVPLQTHIPKSSCVFGGLGVLHPSISIHLLYLIFSNHIFIYTYHEIYIYTKAIIRIIIRYAQKKKRLICVQCVSVIVHTTHWMQVAGLRF